jgi:hypothetical protein
MSKARIARFIEPVLSKRNTTSGQFMDQKKVPAKSKFKRRSARETFLGLH